MKVAEGLFKDNNGKYRVLGYAFDSLEAAELQAKHYAMTLVQWPLMRGGVEQWVEVPEEEPKLRPCIYCGGQTEVTTFGKEVYYVRCQNSGCNALGPENKTRQKAIEGHNELARKVGK